MNPQEQKIFDVANPIIEELGYDIVRLQMQGGSGEKTLQIMIERKDRENLIVDDCAKVTRTLSYHFDEVEDPVQTEYNLEVSSPGIDRPLTKPEDFNRFKGFNAKISMDEEIGGKKRLKGKLEGLSDDGKFVLLHFKDGREKITAEIPIDGIKKAKLLLTDELIKASMKGGL
ncbi:MAG: ribosome maturation factor RimP [Alphaproteobacteria bacterium]|nr:ribosome maturation factor RimP [Alphaproteobacteria bacterium]